MRVQGTAGGLASIWKGEGLEGLGGDSLSVTAVMFHECTVWSGAAR
jgi:hypothetical protein